MKAQSFMMAILALGATLACEKEEGSPAFQENVKHTVTIHADISAETKTVLFKDGDNYKGLWEKGDVIYIYEKVVGVSPDGTDTVDGSSGFVTSSPLASGGTTATFTATFGSYYWEGDDEYKDYTFTYSYVASSVNPWYMHTDYETGEEYLPLLLNPTQEIYSNGISTGNDMLVSKWAEFNTRPSDISFQFARLGTIVEITLSGFESGDVIQSGSWYTGDNFVATVDMEDILCYNPETGKYKYSENAGEMISGNGPFNIINFTSADPERPIVADASGKAVIYLRSLPGDIKDWFGIICTVDRGGETYDYSKLVNLTALGKSLTFKEGGLTHFEVGMKPAVVEAPAIMYVVPKPRTGFIAMWPADPHAAGYECYYQRRGDWYDETIGDYVEYEKVNLSPVAGTGEMEGMYYVQVPSGLEADEYHLYARPIPDGDSGLKDLSFTERDLYVGIPRQLDWPNVDSYHTTVHLDKSLGSIWKVYEDGEELFPWYFNVTNVKTNWGHLYADDENLSWTLSTCTESSLQHDGEIANLTLKMSKTRKDKETGLTVDYVNTAKVYGIAADGTATEIAQPEAGSWSETEKYYDYDFTVGSYNGFRIEGSAGLHFSLLRVSYYAPTGE